MPINLENWEVDAAEGRWRIEQIGDPYERQDGSDLVDYSLRCKWIDLHEPENRATPERIIRIQTNHIDEAYSDFEERLKAAIYRWLDAGSDETQAVFDRDQPYLLKPRTTDQA